MEFIKQIRILKLSKLKILQAWVDLLIRFLIDSKPFLYAHSIENLANLKDRQKIVGDSDAKLKSNGSWSRCLDTLVLRYICIARR